MIFGLTGPNASGKGEAANYIKSKGFRYLSLSDILREESKRLKIEPTRENLIRLGNELRRKEGPAVLANRVLKKIKKRGNYVIDSIRNPAEIEMFRKTDNFILIGIDAPIDVRFNRLLKRGRPGDIGTLDEFKKREAEENINQKENQQLDRCLKMADIVIINDGTLKEFYKKIDEALKKGIKKT